MLLAQRGKACPAWPQPHISHCSGQYFLTFIFESQSYKWLGLGLAVLVRCVCWFRMKSRQAAAVLPAQQGKACPACPQPLLAHTHLKLRVKLRLSPRPRLIHTARSAMPYLTQSLTLTLNPAPYSTPHPSQPPPCSAPDVLLWYTLCACYEPCDLLPQYCRQG